MKNRIFWIVLSAVLLALPTAASAQIHIYRGGGGYLGVEVRDVTSDDIASYRLSREAGVVVQRVSEGSAAEEAGLQEGDVITEYSGVAVLSVTQFRRLVSETPTGRTVDLVVQRNGSSQKLSATIGERDSGGYFEGFHMPEIRVPEIDLDDLPRFHWEGDRGGNVMILTSRPRLGISGTPLTSQMAEFLKVPQDEGILVTEVQPDSPAAKAGLKAGDVIASIDGQSIEDLHGLSRQLRSGSHQMEIFRDGKSMRLDVELKSERPDRPRQRL